MLKAKTPLLVGLLVVAGVVAFIFTFGSLDRGLSDSDTYTVYAIFDDATGLAPGSDVLLAGIKVGKLGKPELDPKDPTKARVPLRIKNDIKLHQGVLDPVRRFYVNGATATRRQSSLIGDYEVAITPGLSGDVIAPDGTILNIVSDTGLGAVIKNLENSSNAIFPQLEKITADIGAVTATLKNTLGDAEGQGAIKKIRDDVAQATNNVQVLTGELRNFLKEQVYSRGGNVERIVTNLEHTSAQLASFSESGAKRLDKILERVDTVAGDIQRFVKDQTADPDHARPGTVSSVMAGIEKDMQLVHGSLENIRKVTENLEQGRGTIGRLLTDDKLINDVERVVAQVEDFTSTISRTQIKVQFRSDYFVGRGAFKSIIDFALQPSPDKYYLLQLVDDPLGKSSRRLRVTTTNDPRVPPVLVEEVSETRDSFKITAQFAKRFHFLTFRYGVMESTGGLGLDADLLNDTLNFKLDFFDLGRDEFPRLRILGQWEFLKHFFVTAGIDDLLNSGSRDWFVGLGVRFVDEDLKGVMPFVPSVP